MAAMVECTIALVAKRTWEDDQQEKTARQTRTYEPGEITRSDGVVDQTGEPQANIEIWETPFPGGMG